MGLERLLKPTNDKSDGFSTGISRRAFLVTTAAAGGGMLVAFYLPQRIIAEAAVAGARCFWSECLHSHSPGQQRGARHAAS